MVCPAVAGSWLHAWKVCSFVTAGQDIFLTVMSELENEILGGRIERKQDQKVNDCSWTSIICFSMRKLLDDYI